VRELLESYFAAERRRDVSGVLEHFHADAVVVLPDGRRLGGRAAVGEFYARVYAQLADLDVRVVSMFGRGSAYGCRVGSSSHRSQRRDADTPRVNVLRTTAGALTSALTWGLFALVATGGSVRSLVTWSDREEAHSNVARWLGSQP
jgi:ketosteroid isomerase-like protein